MRNLYYKGIMIVLLTGMLLSLVGCSSSADPVADSTKYFATISRIERLTPGGMQLSDQQANQLIEIINPVVSGMPFTPDLAEEMLDNVKDLLTKEQKALVEENMANAGTPGQGQGPGESGGTPGEGMAGGGTGTPGSGNGMNMFLRLDETIAENYQISQ